MTHCPVSGSYRLGGCVTRRGRGAGSGGGRGGVMGVEESSSALAGDGWSLDSVSGVGLSSCAGLAGGDIGAGSGTTVGALGVASVVGMDSAGACGGTGGCGRGHRLALLGGWWAGGCCGRIVGVAAVKARRKRRLRNVIRPEPSTLTRYWSWPTDSTTFPDLSHLVGFGPC